MLTFAITPVAETDVMPLYAPKTPHEYGSAEDGVSEVILRVLGHTDPNSHPQSCMRRSRIHRLVYYYLVAEAHQLQPPTGSLRYGQEVWCEPQHRELVEVGALDP